jgi:DNA-binding HxlR family transcriptional regulator
VLRNAKPVVPPYVIYTLTPSGQELAPVLQSMADWAIKNSPPSSS